MSSKVEEQMFTQIIGLVDSDRNILTEMSIALKEEGYEVIIYIDAQSALGGFRTSRPDLAILSIEMPRIDSLEMLRRLRQTCQTPVIFLTSKDGETDELVGLKMGADGVLHKPFSQRVLAQRVKTVLRRVITKSEDGNTANTIMERGQLRLDAARYVCAWKDRSVSLTATEFLLLKAIVGRPGVVKSRDALMDAAYKEQVYVDDRTVDAHIKRIRKKLKAVDDSFDMIETLYGAGYRFKES
jgi:two-component system response regulator ChvI